MTDHTTGLEALRSGKPLADQGRDAYHTKCDGQGFLKEQPKSARPMTDYERLGQVLYDGARKGEGVWHSSADALMLEGMGFPELAHQIREGLRDAAKERTKPVVIGTLRDGCEYVACSKHGYYFPSSTFCPGCLREEAAPSPRNTTTEAEFTEEEIAVVKAWCKELEFTPTELAKYQVTAIRIWPSAQYLSRAISIQRVRDIAEHLANTEAA